MSLIKATIFSSYATVINAISKLVLNKLLAIYVGPAGYSIIGQFQNFIAMMSAIGTAGVSSGVTKLTAEFANDKSKQINIWSTSFALGISMSVIVGVIVAFFYNDISKKIFTNDLYSQVVLAFALIMPLLAIYTLTISILTGLQLFKISANINVAFSLLSMLSAGVGAVYFGISGVLYSIIVTYITVGLLTLFVIIRMESIKVKFTALHIDPQFIKLLLAFTLMSVITSITGPLSFLYIRQNLIIQYGLHDTGMWDAMNRISGMIMLFIAAPLNMYLLPKLSSLKSKLDITSEILGVYRLGIPIIVPLLIAVYFFRDGIILILFTKDFSPMESLFAAQLIGDFFKSVSMVISYYFLSKSLLRNFVALEVFFQTLLVCLTVFMTIGSDSIASAVGAYAITSATCSVFYVVIFLRLRRNDELSPQNT